MEFLLERAPLLAFARVGREPVGARAAVRPAAGPFDDAPIVTPAPPRRAIAIPRAGLVCML
jgi:hypothetical protein